MTDSAKVTRSTACIASTIRSSRSGSGGGQRNVVSMLATVVAADPAVARLDEPTPTWIPRE